MELIAILLVLSLVVNILLYHQLGQTKIDTVSKCQSTVRALANLALRKRDKRSADMLNAVADYFDVNDGNVLEITRHFKDEECSSQDL